MGVTLFGVVSQPATRRTAAPAFMTVLSLRPEPPAICFQPSPASRRAAHSSRASKLALRAFRPGPRDLRGGGILLVHAKILPSATHLNKRVPVLRPSFICRFLPFVDRVRKTIIDRRLKRWWSHRVAKQSRSLLVHVPSPNVVSPLVLRNAEFLERLDNAQSSLVLAVNLWQPSRRPPLIRPTAG